MKGRTKILVSTLLSMVLITTVTWSFWSHQRYNQQNPTDNNGFPSQAQRAAALAMIPQQRSSGPNLYSVPSSGFQKVTSQLPINNKAIGAMIANIPQPMQLSVPTIPINSPEIPTGCPAQFVTAMISDNQGGVWVADEDSGLYHGIPSAGLNPFTWIHYDAQNNPGLVSDNIYSLCLDSLGRLWVGTLRDGVCVFNGKQWANYNILNGPLGSHVFAIGRDPQDSSIWMCTENGVSIYDVNKNTWRYITRADGLPPNPNCIAFAQNGTAYVGSQSDGLAVSAFPYREWRIIRGPAELTTTPYGSGLPGNLINSLTIDNNGTIFVGTDEGLAISDDGGANFHYERGRDYADKVKGLWHPPTGWQYPSQEVLNGLLQEDHINCVSTDDAGHLWLGTWRNGYEMLDVPQQTTYQATYLNGTSPKICNVNGYVNVILPLQRGSTLIGWYGNGVTLSGSIPLAVGASQTTSTANKGPPLPLPAFAPSMETLKELCASLEEVPLPSTSSLPEIVPLNDDWMTEGSWLGRYGRYWACLFGLLPNYEDYIWRPGGASLEYEETIGLHHVAVDKGPYHFLAGDVLRDWIGGGFTTDERVLELPELYLRDLITEHDTSEIMNREMSEVDDHGEGYSTTWQGPGVYLFINIPTGQYELSLYFLNFDGQAGRNLERDYSVSLNALPVTYKIGHLDPVFAGRTGLTTFQPNEAISSLPANAECRVVNFWNGVWKRFLVRGPTQLAIRIDRNYSLNTIISGAMLDPLEEHPEPYYEDATSASVESTLELSINQSKENSIVEDIQRTLGKLNELETQNPELWASDNQLIYVLFLRWSVAHYGEIPKDRDLSAIAENCYYHLGLFKSWEALERSQAILTSREIEQRLQLGMFAAAYSGDAYGLIQWQAQQMRHPQSTAGSEINPESLEWLLDSGNGSPQPVTSENGDEINGVKEK